MNRRLIPIALSCIVLVACIPVTPVAPTPSSQPSASAVPTGTPAPTVIPTMSVNGLQVLTREIQGPPTLDPLDFTTVQGQRFEPAWLLPSNTQIFPDHTFFKKMQFSMWAQLGPDRLIAQESYDQSGAGIVSVTRAGREIYKIPTGGGSPVAALRGLWVYDDHWVLETAFITLEINGNNVNTHATGQLSLDGALLNDANGYQEAFDFQTIGGRPFYFFKRSGTIDAWYDGREIPLGYDQIPHYGCCSGAQLNPWRQQNRVAFFGVRGGKWYFVEIGTPDSFTP